MKTTSLGLDRRRPKWTAGMHTSTLLALAVTLMSTTVTPFVPGSEKLNGQQIVDVGASSVKDNLPVPVVESETSSPALFTSVSRFLTTNGTVVIAQRGSTTSMPCEVVSLGDGVITWLRRKDHHLLTVAHVVYSSDERFHVQGPLRSSQTQNWALQIRFVQERDAGLYECQMSTHPPSSLFVELIVVEARAEIEGGSEKYVKSGSTLRLTCHIRQNSVAPDYVFWYHDGRMINYDETLGVSVSGDQASSTLVVGKAHSLHSGNYSCVPSNVRPASVFVHILNGEKPAAMQHSNALSRWSSAWLLLCVAMVTTLSDDLFL